MNVDISYIARIVREEIDRFLRQKGSETAPESSGESSADHRNRALVVFLGTTRGLDSVLPSLKALSRSGVSLTGLLSNSAKSILDRQQILEDAQLAEILDELPFENLSRFLEQFCCVIVPSLTRNTAAKLALGITDNAVTYALLVALGKTIPVVAGTDGLYPDPESECSECALDLPGMQAILENYQQTLESFGMRLVKAKDIGAEAQLIRSTPRSPNGIAPEGLLTAEDAAAIRGPKIVLNPKTIVTPLARDVLKQRGITIENDDSSK